MKKTTQKISLVWLIAILCIPTMHAFSQQYVANGNVQVNTPYRKQSKPYQKTLKKVLEELKSRYQINFAFKDKVVAGKVVRKAPDFDQNVDEMLSELLRPLGLKHELLQKKYYVIYPESAKPDIPSLLPDTVGLATEPDAIDPVKEASVETSVKTVAVQQNVTGTVTGEDDGQPVPGVNVVVKGTSKGTVTDFDGRYSIEVTDDDATLVFSYLGYRTQEVPVNGRSVIDLAMALDVSTLDEVVVIGYGTQQRKDITGSVSSVKGEAIKNLPVNDIAGAIQGRMAGVEVIRNSSEPGSGSNILIRGVSSLRNKGPLYIIDGVRQSDNNINIQDIESINVLKDASAASIYGAAAAGGVIVITTKKGKLGKPSINFNQRYGLTHPILYDLLGRDDYVRLKRNLDPGYLQGENISELPDTDWVDALYSVGTEQNYNLSISGATENTNYFVSGLYNKEDGVYLDTSSELYGARLNSEFNLSPRIKVGEQLYVYQRNTNPESDVQNPPFRSVPIMSIFDETNPVGGFGQAPPGFGGANFVGIERSTIAEEKEFRLQGNVYAEVDLPLNLTFRTTLGYSKTTRADSEFQLRYDFGPVARPNNQLEKEFVDNATILNNYTLTYHQTFGKHSLTLLAGYEQIRNKNNSVRGIQTNQAIEPNFAFFPTTETEQFVDGGDKKGGGFDVNGLLKSQFGRLTYDYANRYLLQASIRRDANFTKFGPGNQYGIFPAVSAGWVVSEEPFFESLKSTMNQFKIRGSYGVVGNDNIPSYQFLSTFDLVNAQDFTPNGERNLGYSQTIIPNPDIKWESIYQTTAAIDMEFLKGKIYSTVEWYNKTTEDMLYGLPVPQSSGITKNLFLNIGSVRNQGFEFLLGFQNQEKELGYDLNFTAAFNENEVLNLDDINENPVNGGGQPSFGILSRQSLTRTQVGQPFGQFFGLRAAGIYQSDAEAAAGPQFEGETARAGDLRFEDVNGDGILSDDDQTFIGNPNPKFVYGFNFNFNWKGLDLRMLFNGVAGVDLFNVAGTHASYLYQDGNTTDRVFQASFLGDNGLTGQPRLGYLETDGSGNVDFLNDPNGNYTRANSFLVEDGSYVKLKNLQLGYNLPSDVLAPLSIQQLRIFLMANNLFTITDYSGLDPEIGGGVTSRGLDETDRYPQARYFSIGMDITF